jgi:hypothetical protein
MAKVGRISLMMLNVRSTAQTDQRPIEGTPNPISPSLTRGKRSHNHEKTGVRIVKMARNGCLAEAHFIAE